MKNILSSAVLGTALATAPIHTTEAQAQSNYIETVQNVSEKNVCNSDIAVKNAKNRVFVLVRGPETGKNDLTFCENGEKRLWANAVTGRPHKVKHSSYSKRRTPDGYYLEGNYTPEGNYHVKTLDKHHVSSLFNTEMPNAVEISTPYWIHNEKTRDKKNGKLLQYASHGCVRLTWNDSENFFNMMKEMKNRKQRVEVIIQGTNPYTNKDGK